MPRALLVASVLVSASVFGLISVGWAGALSGPGESEIPGERTPGSDLHRQIEYLAGNRQARAQARLTLLAQGPGVIAALSEWAGDPRFALRWEIVDLLGQLADPAGVEILLQRIEEDPNPHVRWRAMWALKRIKDGGLPDLLLSRARATGRRGWNAAVAFSLFADPRALPFLLPGLESEDSWVRWEAVDALGRVHDGQTSGRIGALLLRESSVKVRQEAVLSLAQIGDEEAVAVLARSLSDPSPEVRWRAAMGLARHGGEIYRKAVEESLAREGHPEARKYFLRALGRWSTKG